MASGMGVQETDRDLAEARAIVKRVLGGQQARVFLFGSRARGTSGRHSDIDIGILPLEPLGEGTLALLREAFEESTIPFHVDVVDLTAVDEALGARILREGIPWDD